MKDIVLPLLAGMGCGVLSAWGVGGGTLLLLVMTLFFGVDQAAAQGVNLLYFLPTAAMGLIRHPGRKTAAAYSAPSAAARASRPRRRGRPASRAVASSSR